MVYNEKQSMSKLWWIMIPMFVTIIIMITFWLGEKDPTEKEEVFAGLITVVLIQTAAMALFFTMSLRTRIDEKGVTFSFKPFLKERNYTWADIEKVWVRKYKPVKEYGGWGFKGGFRKKTGRAYNIWGNKGLQIHLKNGKKVLIGTQQHDELVMFLERLKEKYDIDVIAKAELTY